MYRFLVSVFLSIVVAGNSTADAQNDSILPPMTDLNRLIIGESDVAVPSPPPRNGSPDQRYWIVSAQHCDYSGNLTASCCKLQYFEGRNGQISRCLSKDQFEGSFGNGVPICLIIHGSFAEFDGVYARSTSRWLRNAACNQPFEIVFLTWPSDRPLILPLVDVGILGRRASRTGFFAADLINNFPPNSPVCLVGHSHGTRVAAASLHLLGGGRVLGQNYQRHLQPRQLRTVLLAAAIDHHWLNPGERFGQALCATESLINVRNNQDYALKMYFMRKPFGRRALAISGLTNSDRTALDWRNGRVKELDVSRQVGRGHIMMRYAEQPQLAHLILPSLLVNNRQP